MLVRMAHWKCRKECWGKDRELFDRKAVPILQTCDGFLSAMLLGEQGGPGRIAFSTWINAESHDRFAEGPELIEITRMFEEMYVGGDLPEFETYEVRGRSRPDDDLIETE